MSQTFQRRVEHFNCAHCGYQVQGNGYTNHCPACLWSMHVDVHPGDRASACHGLMPPTRLGYDHNEFFVIHRCQKCGHEKKNKLTAADQWRQLPIATLPYAATTT